LKMALLLKASELLVYGIYVNQSVSLKFIEKRCVRIPRLPKYILKNKFTFFSESVRISFDMEVKRHIAKRYEIKYIFICHKNKWGLDTSDFLFPK